MQLLTKEIEKKLPKLYSQEHEKNPVIIAKFFCPWNQWKWICYEGEKQENGDWLFFGMVYGDCHEIGYFLLSELNSVSGPFGLKIERDKYFGYEHRLNEFR